MVDMEWPLQCDRRAAVLCVADDACLNTILDKKIGIRTHRNNTRQFKFKDTEIPIIDRQKRIYDDFCMKPVPYTIVRHERFDEVNGANVVAIRHIPKNIVLFELCGQLYPVSDQFLIPGVNDFSTVTSSINDKNYMFLGPVAFINHDCSPNVQWHSRTKSLSCVRTIKNILSNDEILLSYGPHFFGINNIECRCKTCEATCRGFFSVKELSVDLIQQNSVTQPIGIDALNTNNSDDQISENGDDISGPSNLDTNTAVSMNLILQNEVKQPTEMEILDNENSDNDNAYKCDKCHRIFKFQSWFMKHKTTHRAVGIHQCNHCPKNFKRKDNLKRHSLSHFSGDKYDCSQCGQSFNLKFNLTAHIKMKHTQAIFHKCSKCEMKFKDVRNKRYHENVKHNMVYPFACPCGERFGVPNLLHRHRKKFEH